MTANDAVRIALVALALILAVVTWRRSGPSGGAPRGRASRSTRSCS